MLAFPLDHRRRGLVWELAKRDVLGRYRGAAFGVLWSVLQPFLMLAVYTVAFGSVLGARWPGVEGTAGFALVLFVGLIVHGFLAECVSRAPALVAGNTNYVKRVVFPLEVLPWPVVLSAGFHLLANLCVLAVVLLASGRGVPPHYLLLPLLMLPFAAFCVGLVWWVGALSVYFRDLQQLVPPLLTAMLFLSSAIIPPSVVPENFALVFALNPLTVPIDAARAVALDGVMPNWPLWGLHALGCALVFASGLAVFQRLRRGFASVL